MPDLDTLARAADAELAQSAADTDADADDDDADDSPLRLSPSEEKYKSLEAMSADIKKLDEVFEVLASVPWLSEGELRRRDQVGAGGWGLGLRLGLGLGIQGEGDRQRSSGGGGWETFGVAIARLIGRRWAALYCTALHCTASWRLGRPAKGVRAAGGARRETSEAWRTEGGGTG